MIEVKFKRVNVDTVRCLITEEELHENGLDVDDFLANDGKTEEFLRRIITMAETEVGYKVHGGNISIQVSVLPDHVLALTFSEKTNAGIMNVLENLKSVMENLSKNAAEVSQAQQEAEESEIPIQGAREKQAHAVSEGIIPGSCEYQIQFDSMEYFDAYSSSVLLEMPVENRLYKLPQDHMYFLLMKKGDMNDRQLCRLLSTALDFATGIYSHDAVRAFIEEHGESIIEKNAIQVMQQL